MNVEALKRAFRRTLSAIRYDMTFQRRHGFYYVYAVIVILYVVGLRLCPPAYRKAAAILLVFSDTSILGYFFIGGIVLLERSQNTFESLFITPLRLHEYFIAKVASLTVIALVMSLAVVLGGYGAGIAFLPLVLSIVFGSTFFTLLGIIIGARVRSINAYFGVSMLLVFLLILPLLGFFGITDDRWFLPFPTQASIVLLEGALSGLSFASGSYAAVLMLLWIAGAYLCAASWFKRYVLVQTGDEQWKII